MDWFQLILTRIREGNNGYLGVICHAISPCSEIEHIEHGCLHRILCYRVWAQSCTQVISSSSAAMVVATTMFYLLSSQGGRGRLLFPPTPSFPPLTAIKIWAHHKNDKENQPKAFQSKVPHLYVLCERGGKAGFK